MYNTNINNLIKILANTTPSLVFIAQPWGVFEKEQITEISKLGYSAINLDMEDINNIDSINGKIEKHMVHGKVMLYGTAPESFDDLDNMFPDDFTYCWLYPNSASAYYSKLELKLKNCSNVKIPPHFDDDQKVSLWANRETKLKKMAKNCYEYQKNILANHAECRNTRIIRILV